jgi:flagellar hook-associated protein 1 FlgK
MAENINNIHKAGIDLNGNLGEDFFIIEGQGSSAATIQVNPNIEHNVSTIAASSVNELLLPGNGDQARLIAEIKNALMEYDADTKQLLNSDSGSITIGMFYQDMVIELGSATSDAGRMVENQQALTEQTISQRESVKGVSEDEEISNMILYQHAFNASAKVISVIDEMLNTIINGMKV